jgi:Arc/MetJ-type ribon-helix-helix transcriptional regulator
VLVGKPRTLAARMAMAKSRDLTPVMTRLDGTDLETLDALIAAGIAASRADAVRWALARIRERPAYAQLRERAREIERLKTEF